MTAAAAILAAVLLAGVAIFQACLAAGLPWGRLAWGGQFEVLPTGFRVASDVAILLYLLIALIVLDAAGLTAILPWPVLARLGIWVVFALFALGVAMNLASRSAPERRVMTPIVSVLALATLVVALG